MWAAPTYHPLRTSIKKFPQQLGKCCENVHCFSYPVNINIYSRWAFQPDSELTSLFKHHVTRLRELGVIATLLHKWLLGRRPEGMEGRIFVEDAEPLVIFYELSANNSSPFKNPT